MRTVLRKRLSPTHRAEVSAEIEILPVDTFPQRQKITSCPNADSVRPPTTAPLSVAPRPRSRLKLPVRRSDRMRSTEYVWLQSNGWARIYPSPWVRWPPRGHFFGSSLSPGGKTLTRKLGRPCRFAWLGCSGPIRVSLHAAPRAPWKCRPPLGRQRRQSGRTTPRLGRNRACGRPLTAHPSSQAGCGKCHIALDWIVPACSQMSRCTSQEKAE
jgi:hypothetical protein